MAVVCGILWCCVLGGNLLPIVVGRVCARPIPTDTSGSSCSLISFTSTTATPRVNLPTLLSQLFRLITGCEIGATRRTTISGTGRSSQKVPKERGGARVPASEWILVQLQVVKERIRQLEGQYANIHEIMRQLKETRKAETSSNTGQSRLSLKRRRLSPSLKSFISDGLIFLSHLRACLLLPPVDVGVFFIYKNANAGAKPLLKKALAEALVTYYAFAGEIMESTASESELLCNNRGLDFVEAFADVELRDLNVYNPNESIEGKLVPLKKHGVLAVQVTELKCRALGVACTFDHRVADTYSANMFLVSWAEIAQSKPLSQVPSFRRSLLCPRLGYAGLGVVPFSMGW
ncbi:hypothetical protein LguiB_006288 [Lonicera macranthoides]